MSSRGLGDVYKRQSLDTGLDLCHYTRVNQREKPMTVSNVYLFHVQTPNSGSYIEQFVNTEQYWKGVGEAQHIVEARVPSGSRVSYYGTN